MSTAPPPLPSADVPFRDFLAAPRLGDGVGLFKVVECTPDSLRLSVHAGWMIVMGLASILVAVIAFVIFWFMPRSDQIAVTNFSGYVFATALFAAILGAILLANIGHSMEVDRIRRVVKVTWLYVRTREYPADRLKAVVLRIEKPTERPAIKTKSDSETVEGPPVLRFANSVECYFESTDERGQTLRIKVAESALSSREDWPSLGSTAVHVSKVLRLPLRVEGAVDQLRPAAQEQFATLARLATSSSAR